MPDLVQLFDQFGVAVENQTIIIANYYKKLLTEGVPETLATALVIQFAAFLWKRNFEPGDTNGD